MTSFITAFFFVFGSASIGYILAKGFIFSDIKYRFVKLIRRGKLEHYITEFLYCPMCIGFWVGLVLELKVGIFTWWFDWLGIFIAGAITSVSALFIDSVINRESEE